MFYASYKRYWEPSTPTVVIWGTAAGSVATAVSYPFEYLKTKVQTRADGIGMRQKNTQTGINCFRVYRQFLDAGYPASHLYTGFQAALVGRLAFLGVRNLTYKIIYDAKKPKKVTNDLNYYEKGVISGISGSIAALITNPLEILKIRQIGDLGKSGDLNRNYKSIGEGLTRIGEESKGYFRGWAPNVLRAFMLNAVMIYPYNSVNEHLYNAFGDVMVNRIGALLVSAFWGTAIVLPFDHITTKMMNMHDNPTLNRVNYKSFNDVIIKTIENEGRNAFWVGAYPYYLKTLLYAACTIYLSDIVTHQLKRNAGLEGKYLQLQQINE